MALAFNPHTGNGFLPTYAGNGGVKYPQSTQSDVTRERWEISTCGKKYLTWDRFLYKMLVLYLSRDTYGIQDGRQYGCRIMKFCIMLETSSKKLNFNGNPHIFDHARFGGDTANMATLENMVLTFEITFIPVIKAKLFLLPVSRPPFWIPHIP